MRRYFEHRSDQVTFSMALPKKVSFADVCSKQKIKMRTKNFMASLHPLKFISTQNNRVQVFSCLADGV